MAGLIRLRQAMSLRGCGRAGVVRRNSVHVVDQGVIRQKFWRIEQAIKIGGILPRRREALFCACMPEPERFRGDCGDYVLVIHHTIDRGCGERGGECGVADAR